MNKNGYSSGFTWIVGLLLLFVLGIAFVVFNQVLIHDIVPAADTIITSSPYLNASEMADMSTANDKYIAYWNTVPFILVFLVVLFIVIGAVRGGSENAGY